MPTRRKEKLTKPQGKKHYGKRIALSIFLIIVVVVLALAGFVSWNRWLRFNDVDRIQATWHTNLSASLAESLSVGTNDIDVVIDGVHITYDKDAQFTYTIDTFAKTLSYSFGSAQGSAAYWFSEDGNTLIIADGSYTWFDTLSKDIEWNLTEIFGSEEAKTNTPTYESSLVLVRQSVQEQ